MRRLFFCDTPLQVYYAALIVFSSQQECLADLVICRQFNNAEKLEKRIYKSNIFQHVYHVSPANPKDLNAVQLKMFLGRSVKQYEIGEGVHYDEFFLSYPTYINTCIYINARKQNPNLQVCFYDDGIGSYSGEVFRNAAYLGEIPDGVRKPSFRVMLYRAFFGNLPIKNRYKIKKMYVRCPRLVAFDPKFPIYPICSADDATAKLVQVFNISKQRIPSHAALILDTARGQDNLGAADEVIDTIIAFVLHLKRVCILRRHPRASLLSKYHAECLDYSMGLWELICTDNSFEETILIGVGSTAQLSPAIESNKYPTLIFLYKLCVEKDSAEFVRFSYVEKMAQELYGANSAKVFSPGSIREAEDIIKECFSGE